jgi:acyl-[acyl-carrier-protein]-phospholipid O-acyltransferase/long-chain-fatty-acid--[acyl-carrier-protein] ligase
VLSQTNATFFFATPTFLAGYARRAHPYDLYSVRYVVSGAEKLKNEVRHIYSEQFGVRIFEAYGTTEASPAVCLNTPMHNRPGTVGLFMPGMEWRLESVPGIERGGRLWIRGPNVMLGYLLIDNPGVLQPLPGGWYDTGDIVDVDDDGYVTILGRAKRFAKIAGEMVSLTAVEDLASATWPDALHGALSRDHPQKGEEILLVTNQPNPQRADMLAKARATGASEMCVPKIVIYREDIPVLGSGKPDYITLEKDLRESAEG